MQFCTEWTWPCWRAERVSPEPYLHRASQRSDFLLAPQSSISTNGKRTKREILKLTNFILFFSISLFNRDKETGAKTNDANANTKYTIIWQPTPLMWQGTFGKMNNVGLNCVQAWVEFKKQLKLTFSPWTREIFVLFYAWTPPNPLQPWWVIHGFPHHHLRLLGLFTLLLALRAESCCSRPIQQPHSQKAALNWILTGSTCSETTSQRPQNSDKWGSLESSWFVSVQISLRKNLLRSVFKTNLKPELGSSAAFLCILAFAAVNSPDMLQARLHRTQAAKISWPNNEEMPF